MKKLTKYLLENTTVSNNADTVSIFNNSVSQCTEEPDDAHYYNIEVVRLLRSALVSTGQPDTPEAAANLLSDPNIAWGFGGGLEGAEMIRSLWNH